MKPGWQDFLDQTRPEVALLERKSALADALVHRLGWITVAATDDFVLLRRRKSVTGLRRFGAPLAIYAITRTLAAAFVLLAAPHRAVPLESLPVTTGWWRSTLPPDYATVMTSWDGQWYWDIAENGYPDSALDARGAAQPRPRSRSSRCTPCW